MQVCLELKNYLENLNKKDKDETGVINSICWHPAVVKLKQCLKQTV
jgi:hypothetical protein